MKSIISLLAIFCLTFNNQSIFAQSTGAINGIVTDPGTKPITGATVSLLRLKDSVPIKTTLSDHEGRFEFEKLQPDTFYLTITAIGFAKFSSQPLVITHSSHLLTLPIIRLQNKEASALEAVTITGKKPLIERQTDRTIVNVDAFIGNAGSTALDVLARSPGVQVDNEGNISLKSKTGVLILVDDKPTYLSGADLAGYLRSLPSDQLDKIEIMTNPPARYDAAGNAGVINIKTKKIKKKGFNGSINSTYAQGVYWNTFNSLSLNYGRGKWNFFANTGLNEGRGFNDLDIERIYMNPDGSTRSYFNQHSFLRRYNRPLNAKLGVDYSLDKKTTLGIVLNGIRTNSITPIYNTSNLLDSHQSLDSVITADNYQREQFRNASINFNYRHQYDSSGRELSMDADIVGYSLNNDQIFRNASFQSNGIPKTRDTLTGSLPSNIRIYSFKADYTHPLPGKARLEAGIKTSFIKTDNIANYYNLLDAQPVPDLDKTNHFLYDEHINAAYLNYKKDLRRFGLQLGLRVENTLSKGHQLGNSAKPDSVFTRNYTSLFPTIYFSYKPDTSNRHQLVLSYGKRIDRPYFKDLNPFLAPLDKFTNYVGNPFLQPMFSHNFSLAHTFKGFLTTTLFYNYRKDQIGETIELQGTTFVSRPNNIGKTVEMGISLDATLHPAKWWTSILYGEYQRRASKGQLYTSFLDTSAFFGVVDITNQFQLNHEWSAELFSLYVGKRAIRQFVLGEFWHVNISVQKKVLQNKGALKLTLQDVFYSRVNKGIINNLQNGRGSYHNMGDSRQVRFTFSYSFGKSSGSQRNRSTSAETEQGRVR